MSYPDSVPEGLTQDELRGYEWPGEPTRPECHTPKGAASEGWCPWPWPPRPPEPPVNGRLMEGGPWDIFVPWPPRA